jgi:hypothetical protein
MDYHVGELSMNIVEKKIGRRNVGTEQDIPIH